ncbi:hypothetical protein L9F63_003527 [Diploptera punctata]|uniref:Glucose-methanol-choline oxidoreductase N-terminal domain-containing protein n=1 Tax=Diploptera punctata TaxID=6984 RepID=A0AAD8E9Z4_DIPPU|nr:hypothetical protein L9F63_003527 [Diploptera punctata]
MFQSEATMELEAIWLLVALQCLKSTQAQLRTGILENTPYMLLDMLKQAADEPQDTRKLLKEYDFIIVGAGTAGCTLANRLTEVPEWKVLLIEAGGPENFLMDLPIVANYLQFTDANWKYKTEPSNKYCLGLHNNQCNFPRGKVIGGSSVLNYMIYTRGHPKDYDTWAAMGNEGWSYQDVLPYFLKSEDIGIPEYAEDTKFHSRGGYLSITYPPYRTPLAEAFVKAGLELGDKYVDYNAESMIGFSYIQSTLNNGTRWSSSRAFLHPIRNRSNFHIKKYSTVTKIIIDPKTKTARGVQFVKNNRQYVVRAKREVIISASSINSPQLLMLSGIGPKKHLEKVGINVIKDLKVGYNLMDHVALGGFTFLVNASVSLLTERILTGNAIGEYLGYHLGPLSIPGGCEAIAFLDVGDNDGYPELELLFQGGSVISDYTIRENFGITQEIWDAVYKPIQNRDSWMVLPMLMRPKSTGRVMLRDNNPFHKPLIYPNYFEHQEDLDVLVAGAKKVVELSKTKAFQKYGSKVHDIPLPPCEKFGFGTDKYFECMMRHFSFTIYHISGTCKMGPKGDPTAVVDPRLRVHGIKGLRVIDVSIFPKIMVGHTNGPVFMVAEKGADMIKQDWGIET